MQMFERIRNIKYVLVLFAIVIAIGSLLTSNYLIEDLKKEETNRMEVWAEAMRSLNSADENTDLNLVLKVINGNHTIPVIVTDKNGVAFSSRNIQRSFATKFIISNMIKEHNLRNWTVLAFDWTVFVNYYTLILLHYITSFKDRYISCKSTIFYFEYVIFSLLYGLNLHFFALST